MASQINNLVPFGALLKSPRLNARQGRTQRRGRVLDESHLSMIRKCPCLGCGMDPAGVAAHVRQASAAHGKPNPGMGQKPDDRWTVPLCNECHDKQHREGELTFWFHQGISPIHLCIKFYGAKGNLEAMRAVAMNSRND